MKGYEVMEWALDADVDRSTDRLLLIVYTRFRNSRTGLAWPGMEALERATKHDRKAIIAARQRLIARGYLEAAGRRGEHGRGVTVYRVRCPENGTSVVVDNAAPMSPIRDSGTNCSVPKADTRCPETGVPEGSESGTQNSGRELIKEPRERQCAPGAPLSDWRPTEADLAAARQARPELEAVIDTIVVKFIEKYRGTRRGEANWRSLFMRWIYTERVPETGSGSAWWKTEEATLRKGAELGLRARSGDTWETYRDRIRAQLAAVERTAA